MLVRVIEPRTEVSDGKESEYRHGVEGLGIKPRLIHLRKHNLGSHNWAQESAKNERVCYK